MSVQIQSTALASLTAAYTDSEDEDEVERYLEDEPDTQNSQFKDASPSSAGSVSLSPNLGLNDVASKVHGLVSHMDHSVVSDYEGALFAVIENGTSPWAKDESSPSPIEVFSDDDEPDEFGVVIPPAPAGVCPQKLQDKITHLHNKVKSSGLDMNQVIQQRKNFRNPSIYEKLIQFCSINELGTNYPSERFDPFKWGKESYYEELAKVQAGELGQLQKTTKGKTTIEVVSGSAKKPHSERVDEDVKRKKSTREQFSTMTSVKQTVLTSQPTVTGTKVAFGSLRKRRICF